MNSSQDDGFVELVTGDGDSASSSAVEGLAEMPILRPRGVAQILDFGIDMILGRLLTIIAVCTLIWLPLRWLNPILMDFTQNSAAAGGDGLWDGLGILLIGTWGMMAGSQVARVLATTVVTLLVHGELVGKPLSAGEALARTGRRIFGLAGIFMATMVIVGLGAGVLFFLSMLCPIFLPVAVAFYLYFTWRLAVASPALVLENLSVLEALGRSWHLSVGSFWRWLGVMVLNGVMLLGFTSAMAMGDDPGTRDDIIQTLGVSPMVYRVTFMFLSSIFAGIASAFEAGFLTVYYLDLRMRREGFDLKMRLERMQAAASTPR